MNSRNGNPRVTWSPPSADHFLSTIGKHRLLIGSSTVLLGVAMLITLMFLSPRYEVSASLLFKLGRELKPPSTLTDASASVMTGRRPEDVTSEMEIMKSQFLLEKLVAYFGEDFFFGEPVPQTFFQRVKAIIRTTLKKIKETINTVAVYMGLTRPLTRSEQVIVALQQGLSIEPVQKSDVITVRLTTPDPEAGMQIVNKLIDFYLEQHIAAYKTPRAKKFFEEQTEIFQHRLAEAEKARTAIKGSHAVWSAEEQRRLVLDQQRQMGMTRATTLIEAARLQTEIAGLVKRTAALPRELRLSSTTQRNPLVDQLKARLMELEGNRERLRTKYADDNRAVADVAHEIDEVQRALQREEPVVTQSATSGLNTTLQDIEKDLLNKPAALEGLQAQAVEQARQLEALEAQLRSIDTTDLELVQLEREITLLQQNYLLYAKNLEETRISEAMDLAEISNVSLIAPASSTVLPVWPRTRLLLIGGFLLGFGGAVAVAFILEALHPTVHSRNDIVDILGIPVLATIPESRVA